MTFILKMIDKYYRRANPKKKAYREPEKLRRITKGEDLKRWVRADCLRGHDRFIKLFRRASTGEQAFVRVLLKGGAFGSAPCARQQVLNSPKAVNTSKEEDESRN